MGLSISYSPAGSISQVINYTNTSSSIDAAIIQLLVAAGTGASNAFYTLTQSVSANSWSYGLNHSSSDSFNICAATDLNTNIYFKISQSGSITFNQAYTFPSSDGSAGAVLTTSGSGVVSWQLPTSSPSQVQSDWTQTNSGSVDYIKNKPSARAQSSASRSLNTVYQLSSTRDSLVTYSVEISCALSLTTGQAGTVFLEIASNSGFTLNVQELGRFSNANSGTLTIGLNLVQAISGNLSGYIPAGYYMRLRTANVTSTPTFTYRSGQELSV